MGKTCVGEIHDFYCLRCGNKGIPVFRKDSRRHEKFHRKKLFCMYCQMEINHIEITSLEEKLKFIEEFKNGVYKDEAEASANFCKMR